MSGLCPPCSSNCPPPRRDRLFDLREDLVEAERVALGRSDRPIERAELAARHADVRVVHVAVDDVGDDAVRVLRAPHVVGQPAEQRASARRDTACARSPASAASPAANAVDNRRRRSCALFSARMARSIGRLEELEAPDRRSTRPSASGLAVVTCAGPRARAASARTSGSRAGSARPIGLSSRVAGRYASAIASGCGHPGLGGLLQQRDDRRRRGVRPARPRTPRRTAGPSSSVHAAPEIDLLGAERAMVGEQRRIADEQRARRRPRASRRSGACGTKAGAMPKRRAHRMRVSADRRARRRVERERPDVAQRHAREQRDRRHRPVGPDAHARARCDRRAGRDT